MSPELRIERLYDAAPEAVFDAFVDPASARRAAGRVVDHGVGGDDALEARHASL